MQYIINAVRVIVFESNIHRNFFLEAILLYSTMVKQMLNMLCNIFEIVI